MNANAGRLSRFPLAPFAFSVRSVPFFLHELPVFCGDLRADLSVPPPCSTGRRTDVLWVQRHIGGGHLQGRREREAVRNSSNSLIRYFLRLL